MFLEMIWMMLEAAMVLSVFAEGVCVTTRGQLAAVIVSLPCPIKF